MGDIMEELKPVVYEPMDLIARLISVRAPREGEGAYSMSELELHSGALSRGGLVIPYIPEHGLLGNTFMVKVEIIAIPPEEYRDTRIGKVQEKLPPPGFGIA